MFSLLHHYGTEEGIREAYKAEPEAVQAIIEADIKYHKPMCDRDHGTRVYVTMLRRILGDNGESESERHDARMKAELAKLKKPDADPNP